MTVRIAMWSGPRNLSTTMMRSFGARPDTTCTDEPFYGCWLKTTGAAHPMAAETIAAMDCEWRSVAHALEYPPSGGAAVFYQKHMTHHILPETPREWMRACRHAFLIRDPHRVLASYAKKREGVASLEETGFVQQAALYDEIAEQTGAPPPVVDSDDILANPAGILRRLCAALDIPWAEEMLSWPAGPRPEDGPWASHWYDAVWKSTGFGPPPASPLELSSDLEPIAEAAAPYYSRLSERKL
ncbi:MAG: HAD family hydrolase [Pseudomonadota bacterium]